MKKFLSLVLTFCLVASCFICLPVSAAAADGALGQGIVLFEQDFEGMTQDATLAKADFNDYGYISNTSLANSAATSAYVKDGDNMICRATGTAGYGLSSRLIFDMPVDKGALVVEYRMHSTNDCAYNNANSAIDTNGNFIYKMDVHYGGGSYGGGGRNLTHTRFTQTNFWISFKTVLTRNAANDGWDVVVYDNATGEVHAQGSFTGGAIGSYTLHEYRIESSGAAVGKTADVDDIKVTWYPGSDYVYNETFEDNTAADATYSVSALPNFTSLRSDVLPDVANNGSIAFNEVKGDTYLRLVGPNAASATLPLPQALKTGTITAIWHSQASTGPDWGYFGGPSFGAQTAGGNLDKHLGFFTTAKGDNPSGAHQGTWCTNTMTATRASESDPWTFTFKNSARTTDPVATNTTASNEAIDAVQFQALVGFNAFSFDLDDLIVMIDSPGYATMDNALIRARTNAVNDYFVDITMAEDAEMPLTNYVTNNIVVRDTTTNAFVYPFTGDGGVSVNKDYVAGQYNILDGSAPMPTGDGRLMEVEFRGLRTTYRHWGKDSVVFNPTFTKATEGNVDTITYNAKIFGTITGAKQAYLAIYNDNTLVAVSAPVAVTPDSDGANLAVSVSAPAGGWTHVKAILLESSASLTPVGPAEVATAAQFQ